MEINKNLLKDIKISNRKYLKYADSKRVNNIHLIDKLNIPRSKCIILGSGIMAALNIRKNHDIDVNIPKPLWTKLFKENKTDFTLGKGLSGDLYLDYKGLDILTIFYRDPLGMQLGSNLLVNIDGYYFYSLELLMSFKKMLNRPKDKLDIKLIEKFLNKK